MGVALYPGAADRPLHGGAWPVHPGIGVTQRFVFRRLPARALYFHPPIIRLAGRGDWCISAAHPARFPGIGDIRQPGHAGNSGHDGFVLVFPRDRPQSQTGVNGGSGRRLCRFRVSGAGDDGGAVDNLRRAVRLPPDHTTQILCVDGDRLRADRGAANRLVYRAHGQSFVSHRDLRAVFHGRRRSRRQRRGGTGPRQCVRCRGRAGGTSGIGAIHRRARQPEIRSAVSVGHTGRDLADTRRWRVGGATTAGCDLVRPDRFNFLPVHRPECKVIGVGTALFSRRRRGAVRAIGSGGRPVAFSASMPGLGIRPCVCWHLLCPVILAQPCPTLAGGKPGSSRGPAGGTGLYRPAHCQPGAISVGFARAE